MKLPICFLYLFFKSSFSEALPCYISGKINVVPLRFQSDLNRVKVKKMKKTINDINVITIISDIDGENNSSSIS